jgi:2-phosphosulfolactate phosphatase
MSEGRTVSIVRYPSLGDAGEHCRVVGIDVIRATTTAITAVNAGRRCYPVASLEAAVPMAGRLDNPLLVGELGGNMPYGFHLQNSPIEMDRRVDLDRPVILLSSSGTPLLTEAAGRARTYAACLRNARAQAEMLIASTQHVVLVAGEHRGEFREEDRLCCARIAAPLLEAGFQARNALVEEIVKRWADAPDDVLLESNSVRYLTDSAQQHDVDFILGHIDDLDSVYEMRAGQLVLSEGS